MHTLSKNLIYIFIIFNSVSAFANSSASNSSEFKSLLEEVPPAVKATGSIDYSAGCTSCTSNDVRGSEKECNKAMKSAEPKFKWANNNYILSSQIVLKMMNSFEQDKQMKLQVKCGQLLTSKHSLSIASSDLTIAINYLLIAKSKCNRLSADYLVSDTIKDIQIKKKFILEALNNIELLNTKICISK